MTRVRMLVPLRYAQRNMEAGEEVDMPEQHAAAFVRLGKAEEMDAGPEPKRRYRRRDMSAEA